MENQPLNKEKNLAISTVSQSLKLTIDNQLDYNQQLLKLERYIDYLIQHDFHHLMNILYRVDVSEKKINESLKKNKNTLSGKILAKLLIERELEKRAMRAKYSKSNFN